MNNKSWNGAVTLAAFVALLGSQVDAFAGRLESSMDVVERSQRLAQGSVEAGERDPVAPRFVQNNASPGPATGDSRDPQIAEYLELHGRAVDGSIRSTMMPWSALQQIAN
jgi:hypothetical protein